MMRPNKIIHLSFLLAVTAAWLFTARSSHAAAGPIVLCYHDVPQEVYLDNYGADRESFVETIEYFKTHGYTFVSLDDLIKAGNAGEALPEKTVLLTFDDAYKSFYDFVYPLLAEYKIPSTLAVVTTWIEGERPPEYVRHELMSWDEIAEVARSPYVEVISHSSNLHKGIVSNPQNNTAAAAVTRIYDMKQGIYEDEAAYTKRIYDDLKESKDVLEEKTGVPVRAVAWPYGLYNEITAEQAKKLGMTTQFTLNDKVVKANRFGQINRFVVYQNPTVPALLKDLNLVPNGYPQQRIIQADLDMIYDSDSEQTEENLGAFLDRVKKLRVTTVYLQAFSDLEATGNIEEVYFPNRVLPVKYDLFNRVVHQIKTRTEARVYAWMPMLSIDLPEGPDYEDLYVNEFTGEEITPTTSWYKRLSPFSRKAQELLMRLYEDLAINANIDGIVFQDDGYLNGWEDFHPDAQDDYKDSIGTDELVPPLDINDAQRAAWTQVKVIHLNELSEDLIRAVRRYRPEVKSARTLYAPVVLEDNARQRFAQDYAESLKLYDHVVVMAYPYLEGAGHPRAWLKDLVEAAKAHPDGIEKTVFKIQTYDWGKKRWIKDHKLKRWLRTLVSSGARNIAYYPDDYYRDHPKQGVIREMMSVEDFPFERDWK